MKLVVVTSMEDSPSLAFLHNFCLCYHDEDDDELRAVINELASDLDYDYYPGEPDYQVLPLPFFGNLDELTLPVRIAYQLYNSGLSVRDIVR